MDDDDDGDGDGDNGRHGTSHVIGCWARGKANVITFHLSCIIVLFISSYMSHRCQPASATTSWYIHTHMYKYAYLDMSVYQSISVGTPQECKAAFTAHRGLGSTTGRRQDRSPPEFPGGVWTEAPEGVFTWVAEDPFNVHILHSWGAAP